MSTKRPIHAIDHYDNGKVRFRGTNLYGVWRTFDRTGKVVKETDFSR